MANRYGVGDYQYELVEGWAKIPGSWILSDVAIDSKGRVYVAARNAGYPRTTGGAMLVFDRDGNFIESWGEDVFTTPHGLWISEEDEIYHADSADHTVRKFSTSGELLQTIGAKDRPGAPGEPFNRPCRAKVSKSGDLYVADGYGQNRIHRMTLDGEVIVSWGHGDPVYTTKVGTPATGPGGFNLPHDVTVDDNDRVYVMDRENGRCQVFDNGGNYLTEWRNVGNICDSAIDDKDVMHMVGGGPYGVRLMTLDGEEVGRWGNEEYPGLFAGGPHGLWIDSEGSLYIAEVGVENRIQKFVRI